VSARAEPRFTRDVDVAVAITDDREAEALVHALTSDGYRLRAAVEQDAVERLATVRLALAACRRVMYRLTIRVCSVRRPSTSEGEVAAGGDIPGLRRLDRGRAGSGRDVAACPAGGGGTVRALTRPSGKRDRRSRKVALCHHCWSKVVPPA